jgi:hypothetical protein
MPMLCDFSPDLREIIGRRAERLWAAHGGPIRVYSDALRKVLDDPKQIESARAELLKGKAADTAPSVASAQHSASPTVTPKSSMNVNVPDWSRDHFWEEPPPDSWEFWSFGRWKPKCAVGDKLVFRFDGKPVAEAVVAKIEAPGQSQCDGTGRFKNGWKIYWTPESFVDLRNVQAEATDAKRPWRQAHADAEAFRELFAGTYGRWEFGGSVRRRKEFVGDVEHVVIPAWGDVPAAGGLFGQTERVNLLLQRSDELLAAGTIAKHIYPVNHVDGTTGETTKWGDKYRGCEFRGFNHEIFSAHEGNWGAIFAIRTGPGEFSKRLVTVMQGRGYRQVDGFVERISDGQRIAVPDEETYFKICGLVYLKPEARQ